MVDAKGIAAVIVVLLLAGCSGGGPPTADLTGGPGAAPGASASPPSDTAWPGRATGLKCPFFCEPTVAIDLEGDVFVHSGGYARDVAGSGFTQLSAPPPAPTAPPGAFPNDAFIQIAPGGDLVFHALLTSYDPNTGTLILHGIQFARSPDDGTSWPVNTYLSVAGGQLTVALGADRQFLVFEDDQTAYLAFQRIPVVFGSMASSPRTLPGIWVSRTDDGGVSWSPLVKVTPEENYIPIIGQPVVAGGELLIPYHWFGETPTLQVAASRDGAVSFTHSRVGGGGNFFPALAADNAQRWASQRDLDDRLLVYHSPDEGLTWSEAAHWGTSVAVSPWAVAAGGLLHVAWIEALGGPDFALHITSGNSTGVLVDRNITTFTAPEFGRANTDFAHMVMHEGNLTAIIGDNASGNTSLYRVPFALDSTRPPNA